MCRPPTRHGAGFLTRIYRCSETVNPRANCRFAMKLPDTKSTRQSSARDERLPNIWRQHVDEARPTANLRHA